MAGKIFRVGGLDSHLVVPVLSADGWIASILALLRTSSTPASTTAKSPPQQEPGCTLQLLARHLSHGCMSPSSPLGAGRAAPLVARKEKEKVDRKEKE